MYDAVMKRLRALGYAPTETDEERATIEYAIDRAEWAIKNNINQPEVPAGLRFVWVDMAAGLYLFDLKASGRLIGDAFNFEAPAKSISEGDTSVTFAGAGDGVLTPEARFDALLDGLINPQQDQLAAYRRMRR